ncbi:methyltransferase domain-containing protein [Arthrobacter echini]|uniref:Methyltransferase domain-containing protein n=1 Tax=Arthrobacter echini TaxID=1529066 RepID=A0A4S5E7D8_9MICC|nr:methyltransferase [Arthrobacter echini]THJ67400.1 methyltransferase domain-containing protein [Arthrobacter echini]
MTAFSLDLLRRRPDIESPGLVAVDAADRLLLDTAAHHLTGKSGTAGGDDADAPGEAGAIATINDAYGALTLGAVQRAGRREIRAFQDSLVGERALALNAADQGLEGTYHSLPLDAGLLAGVSTVLMRLPRSLEELEEIAWTVAAHARADVRVLAAGRLKHMSLSMNAVLGRYFDVVSAGRARQKSRVIQATGPRSVAAPSFPRSTQHDVGLARPLELRAYGATFGGAALDPGTRLLLPHLRGIASPVPGQVEQSGQECVIDLGCGNGAISAYLALSDPAREVYATDQSSSAVASTTGTARANGVLDRVTVSRDDALSALADRSAGSIVLNPPFHIGGTVHTGVAHRLFEACGRVLAPGGELWTVWNSQLRYRPVLERLIGPTRQLERSPRYTVTRSIRR